MSKQDVAHDSYAVESTRTMHQTGLLLVTKAEDGKPNAMTIGWGTIGMIWSKPIFIVLVRPSRYTYGLLEETGEFTVNLMPPEMGPVVEFCGTASGRDHDKFAEKGLTATPAKQIATPIIEQSLVAYECKVVHKNDILPEALIEDIKDSAYSSGDFHRVYYGQILNVQAEAGAAEVLRSSAR